MNTLFFVVAAFIILMVLAGLKSGLIKMIFGMISFIVSLVAAVVVTYLFNQAFHSGVKANVICFVASFIIVNSALMVICFSLNLISKLPLINTCNKLGGAILGGAHALILVWIFFAVVAALPDYSFCKDVIAMVEENSIMKLIYDNNLINELFKQYVSVKVVKK